MPTAIGDTSTRRGLLRAILDAVHKEDDRIGGCAVSRLLSQLSATAVSMDVESTIGFGENVDGAGDAKLLINGEIISATGRTSAAPYQFTGLTRGVDNTQAKAHPIGSLVYDLARNTSALDHVRRGLCVETALGSDLDVIGRNLGLEKCAGLSEDQWRRIIKAVAYLPKQTIHAFEQALLALTNDPALFLVYERLISEPWTVFVEIATIAGGLLKGKFFLNSGEPQQTTGANSVSTTYDVLSPALTGYAGSPNQIIGGRTFTYPASGAGTAIVGVYLDTPSARRGNRDGMTNYFLPGGSVLLNTITLGTSPGVAPIAVLVDYVAFTAHHLATDEDDRDDFDYWAYLADPWFSARCLLDQIRAAGIRVVLSTKL